jgi:hypothetical protein
MTAVVCKFCNFEKERKCLKKKKSTVDLNKRRACKLYEVDAERVISFAEDKMKRPRPTVTMRPDWFWDKSLRKAATKDIRLNEEIFDKFGTTAGQSAVPDPAHPLTGDLSRFLSAEEESDDTKDN